MFPFWHIFPDWLSQSPSYGQPTGKLTGLQTLLNCDVSTASSDIFYITHYVYTVYMYLVHRLSRNIIKIHMKLLAKMYRHSETFKLLLFSENKIFCFRPPGVELCGLILICTSKFDVVIQYVIMFLCLHMYSLLNVFRSCPAVYIINARNQISKLVVHLCVSF